VGSTYLLSYTAVSLSWHESEIVASLYQELQDWSEVKRSVVEDNLLQKESL